MGMIKNRRRIMLAKGGEAPTPTPSIDGIPIYEDNCYFASGNGKIDAVSTDNRFFLTGIIDTGSNSNKLYEVTRFKAPVGAVMRFFNDITAASIDYWTIMRTDIATKNIYQFGSQGRYIVLSITKECAADFYLKYQNGDYLVKGNNVT